MKCKNCNQKNAVKYSKYTSGEFCSRECARTYSTKEKRSEINKKVSETLSGSGKGLVKKDCCFCKVEFEVEWSLRKRKLCSSECAKKQRANKPRELFEKKCENCDSIFYVHKKRLKQRFCGKSCSSSHNGRKGGLNSVQGKRSKNEIYFATLCREKFNKVLMNEPIFNGWDADVIVEDFKVAVLWNGKWHYEKITESHSLDQVQNRDKIKIKEITNSGYKPYIIKDMGKEDSEFVKKEFEKFLKYIAGWTGGGSSSVS